MNIIGDNVIIRAIEKDDLKSIQIMTNDPYTDSMIVGYSPPAAYQNQEDWYQRIVSDRNNLRLAIEFEGKFVGLITLTSIDWKNRKADHGIRLMPDAPKRKGIAYDAVNALVSYAFNELNLNKVYTTILDYNTPSFNLYKKCGWKEEGLLRQSIYKKGEYHDLHCISILKEEFDLKD